MSSTRSRVPAIAFGLALVLAAPALHAASSTTFTPGVATIPPGGSATITISAADLLYSPAGTTTVYAEYQLLLPAGYTTSNVACTGIFTGATPYDLGGGSLGCNFPFAGPGVTGPTGNVLTFTLNRGAAAGPGSITFDTTSDPYVQSDESSAPYGAVNTLTVMDAAAAGIPTLGTAGLAALGGLLAAAGWALLRRGV